jgi:diguanylate cyclase (GGDEF)-like protein
MKLLRSLPTDVRVQLAAWLGAFVLGVVAVIAVIDHAGEHLLEVEAEHAALQYAQTLSAAVPDLEALLADGVPTEAALTQLLRLRGAGDVFRFKLYNRAGTLLMVSDDLDRPDLGAAVRRLGDQGVERSDIVRTIAASGRSHVELADGSAVPGRPSVYSEAYVPVIRGGVLWGVIEAYVDQRARAQRIHGEFMLVGGVIAAVLLALAGSGAWHWKRRLAAQLTVEERVRYLAEHDVLSGALNRASFNDVLQQAAWRHDAGGPGFAVQCLDLDRFKEVNDTLGHAAGDTVLREVARRLRTVLRHGDELARLGGDEFAVLQMGVGSSHDVATLARRIVDALAQPYEVATGQSVNCGASVGAAIHGVDATTTEDLLHKADLALYRAKAAGRGTFSFYDAALDEQMRERRTMANELREAIGTAQMLLHYQPLYEADGVTLTGYEALVRWQHPTRGLVPPNAFIPLAEDTGLIDALGTWVLQEACRQAMQWPAPLSVSVNLSAAQFKRDDLMQTVVAALGESGLPPSRLELEITESLLMNNTERVVRMLSALGALGVRIAMDDFGTGYSSLAYLWRFPFDKVKIDRAFTKGLSQDPKVGLIVRSIVSLSHALRIRVNAEGVETAAQMRALQKHGCDEMQGFLLGRPLPADQLSHEGATDTVPTRPLAPPNTDFSHMPTMAASV